MPRKTSPKLGEAVEEFVTARRTHVAKTTAVNESALVRKFAKEVGPNVRCHDLTPMQVERWFAGEAVRMEASSYNKCRNRISTFVSFAQRRGWITTDVLAEVRPRRVAKKERLRLTAPELRELVESVDLRRPSGPRDRVLLAVAANTGLRSSDLRALKVGSVDLDQGVLRVTIQKTGDHDELPLTSDLEIELRRWLTTYAEQLAVLGRTLEPEAALFPSFAYRKAKLFPVPERAFGRPHEIVQAALKTMGFKTKHQGAHTIRRSVGRLVFEQAAAEGHDGALRIAAAVLHHSSVATTETYLGVNGDRLKRDALMKGRSILGAVDQENVVPLRQVD